MSENLSKTPQTEKLFEMTKRDRSKAQFRFVREEGVWYWDIPHKTLETEKKLGLVASLLLPDVNLDKCETLKACFDAIAQQRSEQWVGQIYADIMTS